VGRAAADRDHARDAEGQLRPGEGIAPTSALATNLLSVNGKLPATTVAEFAAWVARSPASRARAW
jgi:hypothetical protein